MSGSDEFAKNLDEKHERRIEGLSEDFSEIDAHEDVPIEKIFHSDDFPDQFDQDLSFFGGFNDESELCMGLPFADKQVVTICPKCECVKNPEMIEPFLSKDLIIPVLFSRYQDYNEKFIDEILSYPHVNFYEFRLYRPYSLIENMEETFSACPDCWKDKRKEVFNLFDEIKPHLRESGFKDSDLASLEEVFYSSFDRLDLPFSSEIKLVNCFNKSLKKRDFQKLLDDMLLSNRWEKIRDAQSFQAVPQLTIKDKNVLKKSLESSDYLKGLDFDLIWEEKFLKGLNICYDPSIPLYDYLDIMESRKDKIKNIFDNILEKGKENKIVSLQKEIENINQEVNEISSSGGRKMIEGLTNFISGYPILVAGLIAGGALGGSIGLGCGLTGAGLEGVLNKVDDGLTDIPDEVKEKTESYYEQFLSSVLGANIESVQIWSIRSNLDQSKNS